MAQSAPALPPLTLPNPTPIHVLLVGAGAIGVVYVSRLHSPANNIFCSAVLRSEYNPVIKRGGTFTILTKEFEGKDYDWEPHRIFNNVEAAGAAGIDWDFIVVGTKAIPESFSCGELVKPAVTSTKTGIILIQNGVGVERDTALLFPNNLVSSAVAFMAATREGEPGIVKHFGVTTMPIGVYRGEDLTALGKSYTPPTDGDERILHLSRLWKEVGGVSARYVEDLQPARWYKLLWNASFGPISVLTNVPSHPAIAANPGLLQFAKDNVTDIWHVAEKLFPGRFPPKIRLGPSLEEWPGKGVSRVGDHKASMLVDVEECRDAEIEVILGEPVRIAKRAGLELPRLVHAATFNVTVSPTIQEVVSNSSCVVGRGNSTAATGTSAESTASATSAESAAPTGAGRGGVAVSNTTYINSGLLEVGGVYNITLNQTVYNGLKLDTTIDTSLPIAMVVRGLVATVELSSPSQTSPQVASQIDIRAANEMCLRMLETDELVTDETLRNRVKDQDHLKLCPHPTIEASDLADRLRSLTGTPNGAGGPEAKRVLFVLQRYLKEPEFSSAFVARGGALALQRCVSAFDGNTLAYALQAMHNLVEQRGWEGLDGGVVEGLVTILVREELTNICRPATSILAKLVSSLPAAPTASTDPSTPQQPASNRELTGFEAVNAAMATQPAFLPTLVRRLSAPDPSMQLASLHLLNVLLRHVSESARDDFARLLDVLRCGAFVARIALSGCSEELKPHLAEYQTLAVRELHRKKKRAVVGDGQAPAQGIMMQEILNAASLNSPNFDGGKWKRVGFATENPRRELSRVGELGLENFHNFVRTFGSQSYVGPPGVPPPSYLQGPSGPPAFSRLLVEQQQKAVEKRCPVARGSMEVTEMLSDYWEVGTGYSTSTTFQPLLLAFDQVHATTLELWVRTWRDLDGSNVAEDFQKVSAMVRSQFKYSVGGAAGGTPSATVSAVQQGSQQPSQQQHAGSGSSGPSAAAAAQQSAVAAVAGMIERFRRDMLEVPYVVIRQRMLKELEMEDGLMSKAAIKNLRDTLFKDSYQFVKQQRLSCLQAGSWFPVVTAKGRMKNTFRFYRLAANKKAIHWAEFQGEGVTGRKPDMTELGEKSTLVHEWCG
ncbi:hypothetical protein M427DRAFT_75324 [Gonapodya prolifera JEL478]|uniref:ELMO domain-containing protein n=1 Tax=Gonapodya prolifera (strain JEL478) TaxID=1344416 RepID=A0A138ZYF9_GONPJ|nr:hypothetical protein M427DRAFT_75324 [Gonapodya prolifera JEL478]|eukprot:KXS09542.1 hypothetical protein M427DRAFT_75324 [Gonapodya prolifera JEL478]